MKAWTRIFAAAAALACTSTAGRTAEIRRDRLGDLPVIVVAGKLEYGDEGKFADAARGMDRAVVLLGGPGGNLHAGIEIGRAIRSRGFPTAAPGLCASACALAWLGGRDRLVASGGRVGFHAAWMRKDGRSEAVPGGNALVGAYLNQLGLSSSAILHLTSTGPEDVTWLTPDDARRLGIAVTWGGKDRPSGPAPTPSASPGPVASAAGRSPAREDWGTYGEWVQVASRQRLDEAVAVAQAVRRRNANTNVFLYDNGWYAVTVGPFSNGRGRVALGALVSAGEAPADSLVTLGGRFVSLEWGLVPTRKPGPPVYRGPGSLRDED